jgi:hypothetical protein
MNGYQLFLAFRPTMVSSRIHQLANQPYKEPASPLVVTELHENELSERFIRELLDSDLGNYIGLAPMYSSRREITSLALSTGQRGLIISFTSSKKKAKNRKNQKKRKSVNADGRQLLERLVLGNTTFTKATFKMDVLAAAVYLDLGISIKSGRDLISASKAHRNSLEALFDTLGGEMKVDRSRVIALFKHEEGHKTTFEDQVTQAWAAWRSISMSAPRSISAFPNIDIAVLSPKVPSNSL